MTQIFISYKRDDFATVQPIVERLRSYNYRVWLDKHSIPGGANWSEAIQEAIKLSATMIVMVSPKSMSSEYVSIEYNAALDANINVIPYVIERTDLSPRLSRRQALFNDEADGFDKLLEALPKEARIQDSAIVQEQLIGRRDLTFQQATQKVSDKLEMKDTAADREIDLIGLPLSPTPFCTTYLLGRANDTLEWQPCVQLVMQLTQDYADNFPVKVAHHFFTTVSTDYKLRILLVRGPLKIGQRDQRDKNSTYRLEFGLDDQAPEEWQDVVNAAQKALTLYSKGSRRPDLIQIFHLGPGPILYQLGIEQRGWDNFEVYQYRPPSHYSRVFGNG